MATHLFMETPLEPTRIKRYQSDAGLAFEKHRWLLPTYRYRDPVTLFNFGDQPLRQRVIFEEADDGEPVEAIPLTQYLIPDAISAPPLQFTLVYEPHPAVTEAFVTNWPTPIYLAFWRSGIPPSQLPPAHTDDLLTDILGQPWQGEDKPGLVLLPDPETRRRAVQALGVKGFHRLYLVAGSVPDMLRSLFADQEGLTRVDQPRVAYRAFQELLSSGCDWLLTSHGQVPNAVPFCFYSVADLRNDLQIAAKVMATELVEADDLKALHQLAGIQPKPRGGLKLSDILPLQMISEQTELSLAWSNLDCLDELSNLTQLQSLNLDATLIEPPIYPANNLGQLACLSQLKRLSIRYLQLDDLSPLMALPLLADLAVNQIPAKGLSPLGSMPSLTSLNLELMPIDDLSPLTLSRTLKCLNLNRTRLQQLHQVAEIQSLEELSISFTSVRDISPLTKLPYLYQLAMDGCDIESLVPLSEMPCLTHLSLSGPNERLILPDLTPLTATQKLSVLSLWHTTLREMPIGNLANTLETLNVTGSLMNDLTKLLGLTALRHLKLADIQASNFSPLGELNQLELLDINFCQVTDFSWLMQLNQLHTLEISAARVANLRFLSYLSELRSLNLAASRVQDGTHEFAVLSEIPKLEKLDLYRCDINSFDWLPQLDQLHELNLGRTGFEDTAVLYSMRQLSDLDLSYTQIQNINGLSEARHLRRLRLEATSVSDLSPLQNAFELEELSLSGSSITDLRVISRMRRLKKLDLRNISPVTCSFLPLLELPRLEILYLNAHGMDFELLNSLQKRHRVIGN